MGTRRQTSRRLNRILESFLTIKKKSAAGAVPSRIQLPGLSYLLALAHPKMSISTRLWVSASRVLKSTSVPSTRPATLSFNPAIFPQRSFSSAPKESFCKNPPVSYSGSQPTLTQCRPKGLTGNRRPPLLPPPHLASFRHPDIHPYNHTDHYGNTKLHDPK